MRTNDLVKLFAKHGVNKPNYKDYYCLNFREVEFLFRNTRHVGHAFLCKSDRSGDILKIYHDYKDIKKDIELIIKNKTLFMKNIQNL